MGDSGSRQCGTLPYHQQGTPALGTTYACESGTGRHLADGSRRYYLTDHLGGTRLLYEPGASAGTLGRVVQAASYYPYGLQMAGLQAGSGDKPNEDLYHGKELTDAHGLDWYHYGARFYDVARAVWRVMMPSIR